MAQTDESAALQDLVRGRLSEAETERLNDAIRDDPALEAEYRLISALNTADPAPHAFPGELGWARLSKAIDNEPAQKSQGPRVTLWQAAAGVAVAVVAWQFTVAPLLVQDAAPRYVTATGTSAPAGEATLRVTIAPTASERTIRTLLRDAGAQIVDGPSAIGLYTLGFQTEDARTAGVGLFAASPTVITPVAAE
ncbi:MAG: hypothetical protein AAF318_01405 [Pseudomonadota bacterium]